MKSIDIVTSALNEEVCIPELYQRLKSQLGSLVGYNHRIIFIDNGSMDGTWGIICNLAALDKSVTGIRMSRTFSLDAAFTCGLDKSESDCTIIMASDLQDPPELIPEMVRQYENGFDQVLVRITSREHVPWVRRKLSSLFYFLADKLSSGSIPKSVSDFRLMSRHLVQATRTLRESNRFLRGLIAWTGYRSTFLDITREERFGGESKFLSADFSHAIRFGINALLANSSKPLWWVSVTGFVFSFVSIFLTVALSLAWIFFGVPFAGFGSIVGLILCGFSAILMILGVIGQYISLIYEEVKARPLYLIKEEINF
jgi:glycosyltransferase involved in cell wall biosynthesis